jgi:hypothetical protein
MFVNSELLNLNILLLLNSVTMKQKPFKGQLPAVCLTESCGISTINTKLQTCWSNTSHDVHCSLGSLVFCRHQSVDTCARKVIHSAHRMFSNLPISFKPVTPWIGLCWILCLVTALMCLLFELGIQLLSSVRFMFCLIYIWRNL